MRSPYYGKKTLLFGVSRTDRRHDAVRTINRIGSEVKWGDSVAWVGENESARFAVRALNSKKTLRIHTGLQDHKRAPGRIYDQCVVCREFRAFFSTPSCTVLTSEQPLNSDPALKRMYKETSLTYQYRAKRAI